MITLLVLALLTTPSDFTSLRLLATPELAQVPLAEPMVIRLEVTNPGSSPVLAHGDLTPSYGLLAVEMRREGEAWTRVLDPSWGRGPRPSEAALAAGGRIQSSTVLFSNGLGLAFAKPGTYDLRFRWSSLGFKASIEASCRVTVGDPKGPAYDAWMPIASLRRIMLSGWAQPEDTPELERFVTAHPSYGRARLILAELLADGDAHDQVVKLLESNVEAMRGHTKRQSVLLLADAYGRLAAWEKLRALIKSSAAEFKGTPEQAEHDDIVSELTRLDGS